MYILMAKLFALIKNPKECTKVTDTR